MLSIRNYCNKIHIFGYIYILSSENKNNLNLLLFNKLDKDYFNVLLRELCN